MTFATMLKHPSAFLLVVMSFGALATVIVHVAMFGAAREADEGTAAHIWQILMAAQIPVMAFFAIKWLPQMPTQALQTPTPPTAAARFRPTRRDIVRASCLLPAGDHSSS